MTTPRHLLTLAACLVLLAWAGCSPADPRSRIDAALATLQSDASGSDKAEACTALRAALAEYPHDAADRQPLAERAARVLAGALRDPLARLEAQKALIELGLPSYEPLFEAVLDPDPGIQDAAATCLVRMSVTAVPVLIPSLLGDDFAARDRATRILTRLGQPVSATLRMYYARILEPFAGQTAPDADAQLSTRAKSGILAFAQVFGNIGDEQSLLALMDGCEALRRAHPDVAAAHLRIIQGLGPSALKGLSSAHQQRYEVLRLMVESR